MKKKKDRLTLGLDLDCTIVDMLPPWLRRYNEECGTNIKVSDIKEYNVGTVCTNEKVLYDILDEPGFFYNMNPLPGAIEVLLRLLEEKEHDIVIITQPPRRVDLAVRDKRRWVKKFLKDKFPLENMIFCHRKELIQCDILFDDKPGHLEHWKKHNPKGLTATLDWAFNKNAKTDFRGNLETGWYEFYDWLQKLK